MVDAAHLGFQVDAERLRRPGKRVKRLRILELAGTDVRELELVERRKRARLVRCARDVASKVADGLLFVARLQHDGAMCRRA